MDIKTLHDTPPWEWPRDAGKTFQKILTDPRAKEADRLMAAELAGNFVVINDNLADALLAIVCRDGEPDELRVRAVISLGPVLETAYTEEFEDPDEVPITERTFRKIQDSLQKLYLDHTVPKEVRRRILEASVRAPETWHQGAIATAYSSGDRDWMLTAVFSMRYVRGFDNRILEALESADPEIHCEAVDAAGIWSLEGAWSHIVALVNATGTSKPILLTAIAAVASIRPKRAGEILEGLTRSDDEQIAEAANDAIAMAEGAAGEEDDEEDGDKAKNEWIN